MPENDIIIDVQELPINGELCVVCWGDCNHLGGGERDREGVVSSHPFACDHQVCTPCLYKYLETSILTLGRTVYECPSCSTVLSEPQARSYLAQLNHDELYDRLLVRQGLAGVDAAWCPGTDCHYATELQEDCPGQCARKRLQCFNSTCLVEFYCSTCQQEWPEEKHQCQPFTSHETSMHGTRLCPGCGMPIQLASGCNDVTCTVCRTRYCHQCGKPIIGEEHYTALTGCTFFGEHQPWRPWRILITKLGLIVLAPLISALLLALLPPAILLLFPIMFCHMSSTGHVSHLPPHASCLRLLLLLLLLPAFTLVITLSCCFIFLLYVYIYLPLTWMGIYILSYIDHMSGESEESIHNDDENTLDDSSPVWQPVRPVDRAEMRSSNVSARSALGGFSLQSIFSRSQSKMTWQERSSHQIGGKNLTAHSQITIRDGDA